MSEIKPVQAQLREIARDLTAIKYRLLGVHASVPLSPSESDPLAEVDVAADSVAGFHGSIEGLLDETDSLMQGILEIASSPLEPEGVEE